MSHTRRKVGDVGSENPIGADNQQERPGIEEWTVDFIEVRPLRTAKLRWFAQETGRRNGGSGLDIWNPQRPYVGQLVRQRVEDMVQASWRHGEQLERNSLSGKFRPARMA